MSVKRTVTVPSGGAVPAARPWTSDRSASGWTSASPRKTERTASATSSGGASFIR